MNTWNSWAGSAALPYLLRAHRGPRALLIHAGAEADAILAAAVEALAHGAAAALGGANAATRSEGRSEGRSAFARDVALDLDLMPFDGCAAVAVPWTPDAPHSPRMIHDALEAALRATRDSMQPVLVRVDAAALPADAAGVEAVANALPDFTQARVILAAASVAPGLPTLAGFKLPRDAGRARRLLPLLLGAARLASERPAALLSVQVRVPSTILAVRGASFPAVQTVNPAAPALRCYGREVDLRAPQNAQNAPAPRARAIPPPDAPTRRKALPRPRNRQSPPPAAQRRREGRGKRYYLSRMDEGAARKTPPRE